MLTEYHRIMDSHERGYDRPDYLLSKDELERISDARVHSSIAGTRREANS